MLYGQLSHSDLRRLLNEALHHNHGDVVELDRDLAEQLADSMDTLVALVEQAAETDNLSRQQGQLDLF